MDFRKVELKEKIKDHYSSTEISSDRGRSSRNLGKGDSELILMRLRRLFKTVVSRNERSRFEERKLCRTNLVRFLADHLSNSCERARYLALDLLCGAVPRLGNKTDLLLAPILPKIALCIQEAEFKDTRLKAVHFLRAFFRHTKNMSSFIDKFVLFGFEAGSTSRQIAFAHSVGIVFDQDIGDDLYTHLLIPLGRLLKKEAHPLFITIYRALKKIHQLIGDDRFFRLLQLSGPEAQQFYLNVYEFEGSDPYLNSNAHNLSSIVSEYLKKSSKLHFEKTFGVVELSLLEKIAATKDCERAVMVNNFVLSLKKALCKESDLDVHLMDLLKLVASLTVDANRPVQMSGFEIFKELIVRVGFHLTPHLVSIINVLRECLTSPNSKVKSKAEKILNKLMRHIHPMTVIWELLKGKDTLQKETVLRFVLKELKSFPYYCFDLVALNNFILFSMQDTNPVIQRASQDCMIVLLSVMRATPVYGIRAEASRVMQVNCNLPRRAMRLLKEVDESQDEDVDSLSDDGTSDTAPSTAQTSWTSASGILVPTVCSEVLVDPKWPPDTSCNSTEISVKVCQNDHMHTYQASTQKSNVFKEHSDINTDDQSTHKQAARGNSESNLEESEISLRNFTAQSSATNDKLENQTPTTVASPCTDKSRRKQWDTLNKTKFEMYQTPLTTSANDIPPIGVKNGSQHSSENYLNETPSLNETRQDYLHIGAGDWFGNLGTAELQVERGTNSRVITPYSAHEMQIPVHADQPRCEKSPGCHVEELDPRKFNYNVLKIETPQTMESIREIDEDDENDVESTSIFPTMVSTPGGYREILSTRSPTASYASEINRSTFVNKRPKLSVAKSTCSKGKKSATQNTEDGTTATDIDGADNNHDICEEIIESGHANSRTDFEKANLENESDCTDSKTDFKKTHLGNEAVLDTCDSESAARSDFSDDDPPPWKRGKELPRTPVAVQGQTLSSHNITHSSKMKLKQRETKPKVKLTSREKKIFEEEMPNDLTSNVFHIRKHHKLQKRRKSQELSISSNLSVSSKWDGCPWQRDIEYASKGSTCIWAEKFERVVNKMEPFANNEVADVEIKKAIDDLFGKSWKLKEEAMETVIRIAKHHPELACDNATKIIVAVCNEVKNFRQSVAGRAILTCGHLYDLLGKRLESKLRMVVAVLLSKSGNRTLAAYFRLVIQCLFKIVISSSPQKTALAFVLEGSRHPNKSSRETAAQFLVILTETVGPLNSLSSILACQMLKSAALFVFDCSAITRYCGKRMFQVFRICPNFEKMKHHYLDVNTSQNLTKVIEQIETKGVTDEVLPINIIRNSLNF